MCSCNIVVISNYVLSKNFIRSKIVVILKYRSVKLSKLPQSIFSLENTSMIGTYVLFFFYKLFYLLLKLKNYSEFQNISSVKYNDGVTKGKG